MKKSKLLIPFLCFVAVLTLVGCDKEPGGTGNENPPVTDVEEFTVTFNTNGGSAVAAQRLNLAIKQLNLLILLEMVMYLMVGL